jgi:hypothetical protein
MADDSSASLIITETVAWMLYKGKLRVSNAVDL